MKHIFFILVTLLLLTSCETTTKTKNTNTIAKEISLPELSKDEDIEFENPFCRVVNLTIENVMANTLKIQPKKEGYASFELTTNDEYTSLEQIDDLFLLVSIGTGGTRDLEVYDLRTGEKVLEVASSVWTIETSDEDGVFYAYFYGEDTPPIIHWEESTKSWKADREIPKYCLNEQLEKQKEELKKNDFLSDGFPLICLEKHRIDANKREIVGTGEYKWDYAE